MAAAIISQRGISLAVIATAHYRGTLRHEDFDMLGPSPRVSERGKTVDQVVAEILEVDRINPDFGYGGFSVGVYLAGVRNGRCDAIIHPRSPSARFTTEKNDRGNPIRPDAEWLNEKINTAICAVSGNEVA